MNSFEANLHLCKQLIAGAVFLQTVEYFQILPSFQEGGIWRWSLLRREFSTLPTFARKFLDAVLGDRGFKALLIARVICSTLAAFSGGAFFWMVLFVSTFLIAIRWRGTFNGGSDSMTLTILFAVTFAEAVHLPWAQKTALTYIAVQSGFSFFIAGISKLRRTSWQNGSALKGFLASSYYDVPRSLRNMPLHPRVWRFLSWSVVLFEIGALPALFDWRLAWGWVAFAFLFQLSIALIFGLNRFFWTWAASYPAVIWLSEHIGRAWHKT